MTISTLDIVTTGLSRPELLDLTYKSFLSGGIKNLPKFRIILNIDPIGRANQDDCISIAKKYCKAPVIRTPGTPNFMDAVKWVWSQVQSEYFLHLEDDWILNKQINFNDWLQVLNNDSRIAQSVLLMKKAYQHGYSFRPNLARSTVCELVPELPLTGNPEKEVANMIALMGLVSKDYGSAYGITDTGRKWAKAHGLKKDESPTSWFKTRHTGLIQRAEYKLMLALWKHKVSKMSNMNE